MNDFLNYRPKDRSLDETPVLSARVKPKQEKIEFEVPLDTHASHYSKTKGEQIAKNVEGSNLERDPQLYTSGIMDRQVLTSCPSGIKSSRYVVG